MALKREEVGGRARTGVGADGKGIDVSDACSGVLHVGTQGFETGRLHARRGELAKDGDPDSHVVGIKVSLLSFALLTVQ